MASDLVCFWFWNRIYKRKFKLSSWFSLMWVFMGTILKSPNQIPKPPKPLMQCPQSNKKNLTLKPKIDSMCLEQSVGFKPLFKFKGHLHKMKNYFWWIPKLFKSTNFKGFQIRPQSLYKALNSHCKASKNF